MLGSGKMINKMEKELKSGSMERSIKVSIRMVLKPVKAF
jgi:hypothetical protein